MLFFLVFSVSCREQSSISINNVDAHQKLHEQHKKLHEKHKEVHNKITNCEWFTSAEKTQLKHHLSEHYDDKHKALDKQQLISN